MLTFSIQIQENNDQLQSQLKELANQNHSLCKKYNQECFYDAYRLFQITDKLNSIFMSKNPAINLMINCGFDFIQNKSKIKKQITNFAMGI